MRLIILGVLIYLLYRLLRNLLSGAVFHGQKIDEKTANGRVEDEMVKDPQCGVYYPKKDMIPFLKDGKINYFCSQKCKDEFERGSGSNG